MGHSAQMQPHKHGASSSTFFLIFVVCISMRVQAQEVFWQPTSGPLGGAITAVAIAPSGTLLASTSGGVFRSGDQAASWEPVLVRNGINSLAVDLSGDYYAASTMEGVLRSTDGGYEWTLLSGELSRIEIVSLAAGSDHIYVGSVRGGFLRSEDQGATWSKEQVGLPQSYVRALALLPDGQVVAGTQGEGIFVSADHGATWRSFSAGLEDQFVFDVVANIDGDLFALAAATNYDTRRVYRRLREAVAWERLSLSDDRLWSITVDSQGGVFVGTFSAGSYRSTNGGATWEHIRPLDYYYEGMRYLAVDQNHLLYAGTSDGMLRSGDNGDSWRSTDQGLAGLTIYDLAATPSGIVLTATSGGVFLTANRGVTWLPTDLDRDSRSSLSVAPNGDIFVGFDYSGLFRSTDGGQHWTELDTGQGYPNVQQVLVTPGGDVFSVVSYPTPFILKSVDAGETWTDVSGELDPRRVESLAVTPSGVMYAALSSNELYRSRDGGLTWSPVDSFGRRRVVALSSSRDGRLFASVYGDYVYSSSDDGETWQQQRQGLYPITWSFHEDRGGNIYAASQGGASRLARGKEDWAVLPAGRMVPRVVTCLVTDAEGYLFMGTSGNSVFRSTQPTATGVEEPQLVSTGAPVLYASYPNPARVSAVIRYSLPSSQHVRLSVYDLLGREVRVLIDGLAPAGVHQATLPLHTFTSGVYWYRLVTPAFSSAMPLIIAR